MEKNLFIAQEFVTTSSREQRQRPRTGPAKTFWKDTTSNRARQTNPITLVIPTRERSEAGEPALSEVEGSLLLVVRDALAAEVCLHPRNHFFCNLFSRADKNPETTGL